MEGDTLELSKGIEVALSNESNAKAKMEEAERMRDALINELRERRRGELRDNYDKKLRNNRLLSLLIPAIFGVILFYTIKCYLEDQRAIIQYLIGCSVELIFGLLFLLPVNKRLVKKHSEYVQGINRIVETEIWEMKNKAS